MPSIMRDQTRDTIIEMAMDILMLDTAGLLEQLEKEPLPWTQKTEAFYRMVVAAHAFKGAADDFRLEHLAEQRTGLRAQMESQFRERLAEIERGEGRAA